MSEGDKLKDLNRIGLKLATFDRSHVAKIGLFCLDPLVYLLRSHVANLRPIVGRPFSLSPSITCS
jgi:hypothetical protein